MRELTIEQRTRLEKIANDEFSIKERELRAEKSEVFNAWCKKERETLEKSPLGKRFVTLAKQLHDVQQQIHDKGFTCSIAERTGKINIGFVSNDYSTVGRVHEEYVKRQRAAQTFTTDTFTRAKSEVLSVIWSMEKPFSECMALIKQSVNKLK